METSSVSDEDETTLLQHAHAVCRAVLGAGDSQPVSVKVSRAQSESRPVGVCPTNEFIVFVDLTESSLSLPATKDKFASFLGKNVGTVHTKRSSALYWGEGEYLPSPPRTTVAPESATPQSEAVPARDSTRIPQFKVDTLVPQWLDRLLFDRLGARYAPDWRRFAYNLDATEDDLRTYLGTYFPRSYAEAFCIFSSLFGIDTYASNWSSRKEARVLDIGCGTGGNLIGLLTALTKHFPNLEKITVSAFDGNERALNIAGEILTFFQHQTQCTISVRLEKQRIALCGHLPVPPHDAYDFVTSFKIANEVISFGRGNLDQFYYDLLDAYTELLSDAGVMLLLDVTTKPEHTDFYPQLLNQQVSSFVRAHPGYSTILPTPCHIHEHACIVPCFTQREFRVGHRGARRDVSRVAFRVLCRKALSRRVYRNAIEYAEYVVSGRQGQSARQSSLTRPAAVSG